jgi:hypothetical protein
MSLRLIALLGFGDTFTEIVGLALVLDESVLGVEYVFVRIQHGRCPQSWVVMVAIQSRSAGAPLLMSRAPCTNDTAFFIDTRNLVRDFHTRQLLLRKLKALLLKQHKN